MSNAFVVDAAARRRRDLGALGLLVVLYLAYCIGRMLLDRLLLDMSMFDMGTTVYRKAQWSSASATAALVTGSGALLVWLVARMARALLGLPRARTALDPKKWSLTWEQWTGL